MVRRNNENPYSLYDNDEGNKLSTKVQKEIDKILNNLVLAIQKDIRESAKKIIKLDEFNVGVGDTQTDERIVIELKRKLKEAEIYKLDEEFYNQIHGIYEE